MCLFFINVFVHACTHTHAHTQIRSSTNGASLKGVYPPWIFDCIIKITNLLKKLFKHPWARAANQKAWVIIYTLYTITQTHVYMRTCAHTGSDDSPERVRRRLRVSAWGQDTAAAAAPNKLKIYNHLRLSLSRHLPLSQLCTSNLYNSHYIKLSPKGILGIEVGSVRWKDGAIRFTSNKAPIRRSMSFIKWAKRGRGYLS